MFIYGVPGLQQATVEKTSEGIPAGLAIALFIIAAALGIGLYIFITASIRKNNKKKLAGKEGFREAYGVLECQTYRLNASIKAYTELMKKVPEHSDTEKLIASSSAASELAECLRSASTSLDKANKAMRLGASPAKCLKDTEEAAADMEEKLDEAEILLSDLKDLIEGKGGRPAERTRIQNKPDNPSGLLFVGCKTEKEISARYRALSKALHPDSPTGDTEAFKQLRQEAAQAKAELARGKENV